jgi:RNA polymerase sigma-70 factor (ECF subfamily)
MPGKWEEILDLYDELLLMNYSPAVVLNRIYALSRVKGNNEALDEAEKLKWDNNHFYFLLLGELVKNNDKKRAAFYFQKAMNLAKTQTEKNAIKQKLKENQLRSF